MMDDSDFFVESRDRPLGEGGFFHGCQPTLLKPLAVAAGLELGFFSFWCEAFHHLSQEQGFMPAFRQFAARLAPAARSYKTLTHVSFGEIAVALCGRTLGVCRADGSGMWSEAIVA